MTIGERIKEIRKAESLTMERFGEKIGVGKTAISKIESNTANPSDQTIRSICREFGVNETWLRTGAGEMRLSTTRYEAVKAFVFDVLRDEPESIRLRLVSALSRLGEAEWATIAKIVDEVSRDVEESEQDSIEAQVEAYRRELLEEKNTRESSVSSRSASAWDGTPNTA